MHVLHRLLAALLLCLAATSAATAAVQLRSPDARIVAMIEIVDGAPRYAVARDGEVVIAPSPLGLSIVGAPDGPLAIGKIAHRSIDQTYTVPVGKAARARDHFNETRVRLTRKGAAAYTLVLRAYDDGVALRYVLPAQPGALTIDGESTGFAFVGDPACHGFNVGRFDSPHEGEFDPIRGALIRSHHLYDVPLVCTSSTPRHTAFAIAEADLDGWGLMLLAGMWSGPGVEARLAPAQGGGAAVQRPANTGEVRSPWRVIMLADRVGDLIASPLIANLNPPSRIADTSWIKPGKAAWEWWSGPYLPPPAKAAYNQQTLETFIDFAGASGLPYMLVDDGWSAGAGTANVDITRARPEIDMPGLVAYARARRVELLLWVPWNLLDAKMDSILDQYRAWGIRGIKVDFMDRDDQAMVAFNHRVAQATAKRQMLLDLHGTQHATGLNRTWPNLITQEGVMGSEYNKSSNRVTATHNVTIPYTRMLLGPFDYAPGGFRHDTPNTFKHPNSPARVQTTRGQALAIYVVFDSPLVTLADSPDAYAGADGFDFLRAVPTSWDETRFLGGEIGQSIILARRHGRDWYIGAMTNEAARTVTVPLGFLGPGRFRADVREDAKTPSTLTKTVRDGVEASSALTLRLAASGGAVVHITPQ